MKNIFYFKINTYLYFLTKTKFGLMNVREIKIFLENKSYKKNDKNNY